MIWILLIVYQLKHFIADYPLQGSYMLGKFKPYPDFILPLMSHAGVHFAFTFLIVLCCDKGLGLALGLGLLDFGIHFVVDRIKASPDLLGRFKALSKNEMMDILYRRKMNPDAPTADRRGTAFLNWQSDQKDIKSNVFFWWSLGADQMAHHLTHYLIIWSILQ